MKNFSSAFLITFIYFSISFIWILYSDNILHNLISNEYLLISQTIKGSFFVIITSIFLYFFIKKALNKVEESKDSFEDALHSLPSPVMVIEQSGEILLVNRVLEDTLGYKHDEIKTLEEYTNKVYQDNAKDIKRFIETLFSEKKIVDCGNFTLTTKNGEKVIWHFNSAPYHCSRNNTKAIIASALDITKLQEKEKALIQQSKMAAMGEILENIAHQWRQPLSTISTASTGIKLQNEFKTLTPEMIDESMEVINNSSQYLSRTIEDFRGFFKPDQKKEYFKISHVVENVMMIIGNKFKSENIEFIKDIEDFQILNYNNALVQVLMNLFANSKDAFEENNIEERFIFIDVYNDEFNAVIQIKDTAGGIPSKILKKIFEPYFTTKHQSKGTGIGLYMSEEIINKHMQGSINVENKKFIYEQKTYSGAMFTIKLPLKI